MSPKVILSGVTKLHPVPAPTHPIQSNRAKADIMSYGLIVYVCVNACVCFHSPSPPGHTRGRLFLSDWQGRKFENLQFQKYLDNSTLALYTITMFLKLNKQDFFKVKPFGFNFIWHLSFRNYIHFIQSTSVFRDSKVFGKHNCEYI